MRATERYVQVETHEVLIRGWHIQGLAVRPEHEMIGHTGFVSVARLICGAGTWQAEPACVIESVRTRALRQG